MTADFHMHTQASDGRLTYQDVIDEVKAQGLEVFSITDHDTTVDTAKQLAYAKTLGLKMIPGIELSTEHLGKSVHVLGYFKGEGYQSPDMLAYAKELKEKRERRAKAMIERLHDYHEITITYEDLLRHANGVIARPHLAKAINERYPHLSHDAIFDTLIGNDSKVYIPTAKMSTEEGIAFLKAQGAMVILAHPRLIHKKAHDAVLELPFDGIEVYYPRHDDTHRQRYLNHAKAKGWVVSAGSDYHGIPGDTKHGHIGDERLSGEALKHFLSVLNA